MLADVCGVFHHRMASNAILKAATHDTKVGQQQTYTRHALQRQSQAIPLVNEITKPDHALFARA
jgi:hypothetical protein